jgi:hypothetical protein
MAVLGKNESIRRLKIAAGKVAAQANGDDL